MVRKHIVLALPVLLFVVTCGAIFVVSIQNTNLHFTYLLDDAYIHMAIAKNLAMHGNWGITPYEFSSSSTSPLWTLIIALFFYILGVNDIVPLILNIIVGILLICGVYISICKHSEAGYSVYFASIFMVSLVVVVPLPVFALTGMEHTMQCLIDIVFTIMSIRLIYYHDGRERYSTIAMVAILSLFVTAVRYDGIFLIAGVCLILLLRKKFLATLIVACSSTIPIVAMGMVSIYHGSLFFPNSVIAKSSMSLAKVLSMDAFLGFLDKFQEASYIYVLVILSCLMALWDPNPSSKEGATRRDYAMVFCVTTLLHFFFSRTGRYVAYLIVLGVSSVAMHGLAFPPQRWKTTSKSLVFFGCLLFGAAFSPLFLRAGKFLLEAPISSQNIYEQQYQMGLFLKAFYPGERVAANDVGAINFLANIHCLDLAGIGSIEVIKSREEGTYNSEKIGQLANANGVKIAIIYDHWYESLGGVPPGWIKAGYWRIRNNVVCGGQAVSFYAVDPGERQRLTASLRRFGVHLPRTVEQAVF